MEDLSIQPSQAPRREVKIKADSKPAKSSHASPKSSPRRKQAASRAKSPPREKEERSGKERVKKIEILLDKLKGPEIETKNLGLKIKIDKESQRAIFQVVDKDSGDVLVEVPPKYLMELSKKLDEMSHVLVDEIS